MLHSPALAHPFGGRNAHFHATSIADAGPSVCLNGANQALIEQKSQLQAGQPRSVIGKTVEKVEELLGASGASLVYAGYPYDPYDLP
jgi:hypothetical protein